MTYLFNNYGRWDIELVEGKGTKVIDSKGKEFIDFTSGIGVCNLGHCHPHVVEATTTQLNKIWHTSNLFESSLQEKVAEKLTKYSNGGAVFFCNSGAEANEAAIKLARKHTGKSKVITFMKSFHGRTFGTMAATGQDKVKVGFGKMLETFVHLPYNDIDALEKEIDENTAAVMLEVIQGEGGVNIADPAFLVVVENLCRQHNVLLIVDEVQTGIGRTGAPFAYQHYHISPDIITSAKGLGNGFPTGAIIAKKELYEVFGPGSHGSTFGGNPLAMTAANATLEIAFDNEFLKEVEAKGNYLYKRLLDELKDVSDLVAIRYKGLMFGLEFTEEIAPLLPILREQGILALSAGPNVLRLLPPLTVSIEELDSAIEIIAKTVITNSTASSSQK